MLQTIHTSALRRHVHGEAYAAVVLSGCYEEAGDLGRLRVQSGDVVLHEAFEAHLDLFPAPGVTVLNVSLPMHCSFQPGLGSVDDPDAIVRMAEQDEVEAASLLLSQAKIREPELQDWPDELALALIRDPSLRLSHWSIAKGIAPWTLSRGFFQIFNVSPSVFRARARTRQAHKAIRLTSKPLASIAAHCGFADQSHMTRHVKNITGRCPGSWRRAANRFKTV